MLSCFSCSGQLTPRRAGGSGGSSGVAVSAAVSGAVFVEAVVGADVAVCSGAVLAWPAAARSACGGALRAPGATPRLPAGLLSRSPWVMPSDPLPCDVLCCLRAAAALKSREVAVDLGTVLLGVKVATTLVASGGGGVDGPVVAGAAIVCEAACAAGAGTPALRPRLAALMTVAALGGTPSPTRTDMPRATAGTAICAEMSVCQLGLLPVVVAAFGRFDWLSASTAATRSSRAACSRSMSSDFLPDLANDNEDSRAWSSVTL